MGPIRGRKRGHPRSKSARLYLWFSGLSGQHSYKEKDNPCKAVTLAVLCCSIPSWLCPAPEPQALPPPRLRLSVWFSPHGLSGRAKMWDFQSLLGAGGVTLEGDRGPQRRRPPLSDGDWSCLRRGLGLVRRGTRASQHLGSTPGKAVATKEPVRLAAFYPRCVPSPKGRVGGRRGRPPTSSRGARGALVACRARVQWGGGGAGSGAGVSSGGLEGCRGPGRRQLKTNWRPRPGSAAGADLVGRRRAWACLVWDAVERRGPS